MNRLIPERIGGKKSGGGQIRDTAVVGLKQRDPTGRGDLARAMGGSEATEQAVERGLDFLARHQSADGSWELHNFGQGRAAYASAGLATMEANTAGTGLALLAFLGAGYTHSDGKYAPIVEKGLGYLLKNQKADGDLFVPPRTGAAEANTWLYSHGIASIALCEALGMSRDDEMLKDRLNARSISLWLHRIRNWAVGATCRESQRHLGQRLAIDGAQECRARRSYRSAPLLRTRDEVARLCPGRQRRSDSLRLHAAVGAGTSARG